MWMTCGMRSIYHPQLRKHCPLDPVLGCTLSGCCIGLNSKRARSMYATLSVCGFVLNLTPLEPVPVWTPLGCCSIDIQKTKMEPEQRSCPAPSDIAVTYRTTTTSTWTPTWTRTPTTSTGTGGCFFLLLLFFIRQTHTAQRKGRPPVGLAARCCPPQYHCTTLGVTPRKRKAAIPRGPALTLKPRSEPNLPCRPQVAARNRKKERKRKERTKSESSFWSGKRNCTVLL